MERLDKTILNAYLCVKDESQHQREFFTKPLADSTATDEVRGFYFMKVCTKCGVKKSLNNFTKRKDRPSGYYSNCKSCIVEMGRRLNRTKVGLIKRIYNNQLCRKNKKVFYIKEDFIDWCLNQNIFHTLYNDWVQSNYNIKNTPSVDRINDYKDYSLDNIQIMTWNENREKSHNDMRNNVNNKKKKSLTLIKGGVIINEFISIKEASSVTGYSEGHISYISKIEKPTKDGLLFKRKTI